MAWILWNNPACMPKWSKDYEIKKNGSRDIWKTLITLNKSALIHLARLIDYPDSFADNLMTSIFRLKFYQPCPVWENMFCDVMVSPGDIHFRIYDDVTDNCILDLQRKISIRNAFASLLFCFLSFMSWDHTLLVKEQKKDGLRLCNAEKDLPKVNLTVACLMHSKWIGLWILANFRYVIIFSGFEKITPRYYTIFACCLFKQNPYARSIV